MNIRGLLKYLLLVVASCKDNDHFRGHSDIHFHYNDYPTLEIKFKKVDKGSHAIVNFTQKENSEEKNEISMNCNGDKSRKKDNSQCLQVKFKLKENKEGDTGQVVFTKEFKVQADGGKEYSIKVTFSRQFQLINYYVAIGKIYRIINIETDIPGADIQTDYKNKILYKTYKNENTIEIEY